MNDREEPLTESWLLKHGATVPDDGVIRVGKVAEAGHTVFRWLELWQGHLCEWWYCAYVRLGQECDRVAMPEMKTCGQLRDLMSALQLKPLKEDQ